MIIRRYVIFAVLIQLGPTITSTTITPLITTTSATTIKSTTTYSTSKTTRNSQNRDRRHDLSLSECAAKGGECDENRGRQVCGTDDRTYPSRCHLMRVQCTGYQVSVQYRGPCKTCKLARDYALKHKTAATPNYIPRCKSDGTFAAVQCMGNSLCWCSDTSGNRIKDTSVRPGKPNCRKYNNLRRSPTRRLHTQRLCSTDDRLTFNHNLIDVFQSEYLRYEQQIQQRKKINSTSITNYNDNNSQAPAHKIVLDWKFAQLDVNRNQTLDKNEFREVKKLVKRVIRPRRCGRTFGKFCDVDGDERLSRSEWNNCIFKNDSEIVKTLHQKNKHKVENKPTTAKQNHQTFHITNNNNDNNNNNNNNDNNNDNNNNNNNNNNSNGPSQFSLNNINLNHQVGVSGNDQGLVEEDVEGEDEEQADYDNEGEYEIPDNNNNLNNMGIFFGVLKSDSPHIEIENESDCFTDQAAALEDEKNGGTVLVMPDCSPDGRYKRVQCYRSTPYCWCVFEDTGIDIPGTITLVKDKPPPCNEIYSSTRIMKGCPEPRRLAFLKELKEFLKKTLLFKAMSVSNTTKWHSENDKISTLSFIILDKNKNKAWERKEWKFFRELVSTYKNLRKCGRKLPKYCDVNNDKRITLPEWMDCLEGESSNSILDVIQQSIAQKNDSVTNKPSKLSGSNPLDHFLRDQ